MKKVGISVVSLFLLVLMFSLVSAEKLDVAPIKDTFIAGETITAKVALLDSNNNPLNANVDILIEDAQKRFAIQKSVQSNTPVDVDLGEDAPAGYWKITATYNGQTSTAIFMVELNELARFEIKDNILTVINTGNTQYTKTIQIVIGDTIGSKQLDLGAGESASFRLVAPEGTYNIRVTDGKTTVIQSGVALTGKVIGVLDNRELSQGPITTGLQSGEDLYGDTPAPTSGRNNAFVYIFLLVVFGAGILLAIERRFRKKALESPLKTV